MTFTPARMLPDVDDLVRGILAGTGVKVGANVPADMVTDWLPYIAAKRIGGASVDPANLDRATVSVDCYSGARRTAAEMAEACRTLLYRAWRFELRTAGQPQDLYRYTATYSLHVRPTTRG
jgi:hypothetical protein